MSNRRSRRNKQVSGYQQPAHVPEPTAADIAQKVKSFRQPGPAVSMQASTGTRFLKTVSKGSCRETRDFSEDERLTPNAPTSVPSADSPDRFDQLQSDVNDVRSSLGSIEEKVVERLKDKAVSEVLKTLILPAIIALVFFIGGLFFTYSQAVNGVRAEIDRVIYLYIREARQENREETDRKIEELSATFRGSSHGPKPTSSATEKTRVSP
ncbi:MAG: hypothetical protein M1133_11890 [Armatimonadetes bacterium]|nr:hypothetical protein [Armatimonadota bacterium]